MCGVYRNEIKDTSAFSDHMLLKIWYLYPFSFLPEVLTRGLQDEECPTRNVVIEKIIIQNGHLRMRQSRSNLQSEDEIPGDILLPDIIE